MNPVYATNGCIQNGSITPRLGDVMAGQLPVHVTVVIPTRNEEAAIVDTIRSIPNDGWCKKLDFLVVDGNSSDRTRELAEQEVHGLYLNQEKDTAEPTEPALLWHPVKSLSPSMQIAHIQVKKCQVWCENWLKRI